MALAIYAWGRAAKKVIGNLNPDLIHHVTLSSIRIFTPFRNEKTLTIWGPLGGGHKAPLVNLPKTGLLYESFRNLTIYARAFWFALSQNAKFFKGFVLVTNKETEQFARKSGFKKVHLFLSDGIREENLIKEVSARPKSHTMKLLWAGRLVESKRPDLAIQICKELKSRGIKAELNIAGQGPMLSELCSLSAGIKSNFLGKIPWKDMPELIDKQTIVLFTSTRDSSAPLVLEAAGRGIPTVAIRSQGLNQFFPLNVAFGHELLKDERQLVAKLADNVEELWLNETLYQNAQIECLRFATSHTWKEKCKSLLALVGQIFD